MSKSKREWLVEHPLLVNYLYHELGKKQQEVGELLGCSTSVVCQAMKEMDLEARTRGARNGEKHPRWGGGGMGQRGGNWQKQRKKALKRDNYECQECGRDNDENKELWGESLHVHHIKRFSEFDSAKEANDLENLITYCRDCHIYD